MKKLELTNPVFIEALAKFKTRLHTQGASTDQQYIKPNSIVEFLHYMEQNGKTKLDQINQKLVTNYFGYLMTRPLRTKEGFMSAGYLNKHREALLRFIEFVRNAKQGKSGVKIRVIKKEDIPKVILTEEEAREVLDSFDETIIDIRDKAIISLLYGCGLRKGELFTLDVQDIDLSKGQLHLPKTKTKYARKVPLTKTIQENIENYLFNVRNLMLDATSNEDSFLITVRGTEMKKPTMATIMNRINSRLTIGKRIGCHMLRHSIGTHLHRFMKLEDVATFLGHRNYDSTMIYTHLKNEYYGDK